MSILVTTPSAVGHESEARYKPEARPSGVGYDRVDEVGLGVLDADAHQDVAT